MGAVEPYGARAPCVVTHATLQVVAVPLELLDQLVFHAHRIYYWLRDVAPVIVKYQLIQLGHDGIDSLPVLSQETKDGIKQWLTDRCL